MGIKSRINFKQGMCITPKPCTNRLKALNKNNSHCYNTNCINKTLYKPEGVKMNILWYDLETTGLKAGTNEFIQLGAIITDENLNILDTFNECCQPEMWNNIAQAALDCNGRTIEELHTFQSQHKLMIRFINFLNEQKYVLGGFNIDWFDNKFLVEFFKKFEIPFDAYFIPFQSIDIYKKVKPINFGTVNRRLETLCKHFDINIDAHDALEDVKGTIELYKILKEKYNVE